MLAKPVLEQRQLLFRQNKLQPAIPIASQAGIGAKAIIISPKLIANGDSHCWPSRYWSKDNYYFAKINCKRRFPLLAKPVLEQRQLLFRQNKLQTAISIASQAGVGAKTAIISPELISNGDSQCWPSRYWSNGTFYFAKINCKRRFPVLAKPGLVQRHFLFPTRY